MQGFLESQGTSEDQKAQILSIIAGVGFKVSATAHPQAFIPVHMLRHLPLVFHHQPHCTSDVRHYSLKCRLQVPILPCRMSLARLADRKSLQSSHVCRMLTGELLFACTRCKATSTRYRNHILMPAD